jgi:hypothetical protein
LQARKFGQLLVDKRQQFRSGVPIAAMGCI